MATASEAVIQQLEIEARQRPDAYRFKVAAFAVFGYVAYVAIILLLLGVIALSLALAAVVAWIGIWLVIATVVVIGSFLRALWVELPKPEGREVTAAEAPRLYEAVREIRDRLKGPPIHKILLNVDHNASLTQVPRLGIFGWQRNYLVLGYTLMVSMTPEEFRAIVAHEIGHASGNHGRFNAWIYRLRQSWNAVLTHISGQAQASRNGWIQLMRAVANAIAMPFFLWYVPKLDTYSFVLGRIHEYEADQASADVAGSDVAASALIGMNVRDLTAYWTTVWAHATEAAVPPQDAYTGLRQWMREPRPLQQTAARLDALLKLDSNNHEVHPCLRDRLIALRCDVLTSADELVTAYHSHAGLVENAAERYLDVESTDHWASERWRENAKAEWSRRHKAAEQARSQLAVLDGWAAARAITAAERVKRAQCATTVQDARELELWEEALVALPDELLVKFHVGRLRVHKQDHSGVLLLEQAAQHLAFAEAAYGELTAHSLRCADKAAVERYIKQRDAFHQSLQLARAERDKVAMTDEYLPHGLVEQEVAALRKLASEYPLLGRLLVARKKVVHFPEQRMYVVVLIPDGRWYQMHSQQHQSEQLMPIAKWIKLPGEGRVFLGSAPGNKWLRKLLQAIDGSEVYRKQ